MTHLSSFLPQKSLQPHKYELWLKAGQSNAVGFDSTGVFTEEDTPHAKVYELSQGVNKSSYFAVPAGEIMLHRLPAQDDVDGIGFSLAFAKRRLALNPEIEMIVMVNRAVAGTGFSDVRWNVGDDLYTHAVYDMNLVLKNYPQFVPMGILWHQGEQDEGQTRAFYEDALGAMVTGMRNDVKNGENMAFLCGTMVESWITADEVRRRPIDIAHRNVRNYIEKARVVDFSALTELVDSIHFNSASLRRIGKQYAEQAQQIKAKPRYVGHRLRVQNANVVDVFTGHTEFSAKMVNDSERNTVIDTLGQGFYSGMQINPEAYTKSVWVNMKSMPTGFGNLISGGLSFLSNGHYLGRDGFGHNGAFYGQTQMNNALNSVNTWVHVCLTWDGSTFILYINNALALTVAGTPITNPQMVEIGCLSGVGNHTIDALLDDIIVLPYAVDANGVSVLFNL